MNFEPDDIAAVRDNVLLHSKSVDRTNVNLSGTITRHFLSTLVCSNTDNFQHVWVFTAHEDVPQALANAGTASDGRRRSPREECVER